MQKLLVANRGEIAVRIMRAARELGLRTVAVYSEADRDAPHTHLADEAYLLGPPEPAQSYLDSVRLLDVARASGADAVHPGYGFLAENAAFAEDCRRAGLLYVGPSVEAIRQMGSKILSKQIAERAGVPVVPSYHAPDAATLAQQGPEAAARLGYPVLVKASAGGGGKGMRIVGVSDRLAPRSGGRSSRSAAGVWRCDPDAGEVHPQPAPHRGAGARRSLRPARAPVRARVLDPTPASENRRGDARTGG